MKKINFLFTFLACICMLFFSCTNTEDDAAVTSGEVTTVYITGASIAGSINVEQQGLANSTFGIIYGITPTVTIDNCVSLVRANSFDANRFSVKIASLLPNTVYYYRAYACIGGNYTYGAEKSFQTKPLNIENTLNYSEELSAELSCKVNLEPFDFDESKISTGVVWSESATIDWENKEGYIETECTENGEYTIVFDTQKYSTDYYCCAYVTIGENRYLGKFISFTSGAHSRSYVDLGLPSGTLWADSNVGANSPEDCGDYFSWGDVHGYLDGDVDFSYNSYKFQVGDDQNHLTKYNLHHKFGEVDNLKELESEDDPATAKCGNLWRSPSKDQMEELCNRCSWEWTMLNRVKGMKITGRNGNYIFLPCAGMVFNSSVLGKGQNAYYWTRTLDEEDSRNAFRLDFHQSVHKSSSISRYMGYSIRPVRKM